MEKKTPEDYRLKPNTKVGVSWQERGSGTFIAMYIF